MYRLIMVQGLRSRILDLGFIRALIYRFGFGFFLRRAEPEK